MTDGEDFYLRSCQGKLAYRDERAAGKAAEKYVLKRPGTKLRIYPCSFCGKVHLTSASLEDVLENV